MSAARVPVGSVWRRRRDARTRWWSAWWNGEVSGDFMVAARHRDKAVMLFACDLDEPVWWSVQNVRSQCERIA